LLLVRKARRWSLDGNIVLHPKPVSKVKNSKTIKNSKKVLASWRKLDE
jgi:hypothetical protein